VLFRSQSGKSGGRDFELTDQLRAWANRHCSDIHQNRIITNSIIAQALDDFRRSAKKDNRKDAIALQKRGHRNRVTAEEIPLFQRCLYERSIEYEIFQEIEHREGRLELTQEQVVPRLIEQVIVLGFYNTFKMTVGVSQILHNYDPAETLRIYECLVQYTRNEKQLADVRRQKSKTMDLLDRRFGNFLTKDERFKKERWYKPMVHQENHSGIVNHWLNRLKPLADSSSNGCIVPAPTSTLHVNIPELLFKDSDPNNEQPYEMRRMHVLLHPPCFSRLARALELPDPEERRNIPEFSLCKMEMVETCS
jgi:hypothetical protein